MHIESKKQPDYLMMAAALVCMAIILPTVFPPTTPQPAQQPSIFQVGQLKYQEELSTDNFLNLENTFDFQHSAFYIETESEYHKNQLQSLDYQAHDKGPIYDIYHDSQDYQFKGNENSKSTVENKKVKPQSTNVKVLNTQLLTLTQFHDEYRDQILVGKEYLEDLIAKSELLQKNNWKYIYKMKQGGKQVSKQNKAHKFFISKTESWDVHLKSIRTHFMQKIFYRLWKVPTQGILKEHCFTGSQDNKAQIKVFLQEELQNLRRSYESFPMKLNLYSQIINKMISSLDLAMHLNGQVDDIIFEVLFKGQIAELFH